MAAPDRLERLTDLVLVLLGAPSPRTLEEIARTVPGYPESKAARRQAFERDKKLLRDEGIPVVTEPVQGPEQFGYRIDPDAFYLPDPGLEPEEQAALHLAVAAVDLGDPSGRDALAKLGAWGVGEPGPLAALAPPADLVVLFEALRTSSELRFGYREGVRRVAPAGLRFRGGRWYLVGYDRDRGDARTFRVDRIVGSPAAGAPGSGAVPEGFDVVDAPLEPWRSVQGDEDAVVDVAVDAVEAPRVVEEVGAAAVVSRPPGGGVVVRLGVASADAMRSWVLGMLDHAEVVAPRAAREDMAAWLEATAAAAGGDGFHAADGVAEDATPPADAAPRGAGNGEGDGGPGRSAPGGAARDRLRRLLAVVAWLSEVGEVPVAAIAERFGVPREEVVAELELAACCGVPPYTPDALLEIVVDGDRVQAHLGRELARPRRLTAREGFALAAAARTILAVPGADAEGALARAVRKLEAVLGTGRGLVIDLDAPSLLDDVRALVASGAQAELDYHSASTDETTTRVVDPVVVVALDGHWYLDAWCHRAGGLRRFRVDRIAGLRRLDVPATRHGRDEPLPDGAFVPGPGASQVVLALRPPARWVADSVPVLWRRLLPDGITEVGLAVGGVAWLERLLLQAGPHARVVGPPAFADVGPAAARRLRARYT